MNKFKYYIPGTILILTAILIVAVPEILIALISSLIIVAGIGALYIGHMFKKTDLELNNFNDSFFEDDPFRSRFTRIPFFRRFNRPPF